MSKLEETLDKEYKKYGETEGYFHCLNNVKTLGCRVFRNSKGKHKVIYDKGYINDKHYWFMKGFLS